MIEADVEPDGRVERAILVQAEPGQFVVIYLAIRFAEVTVLDAPVGNRAADPVDQLPDGGFALGVFCSP
jgi:hypothetical protein